MRGERTIALADFYTGVRRTVMQPDEMMTDIAFPALRSDQRGAFVSWGCGERRRSQSFI